MPVAEGPPSAEWWRCLIVQGLALALCAPGIALCLAVVRQEAAVLLSGPAPAFEPLLVAAAGGLGALSLGWLLVVTTSTTLSAARGRVAESAGPVRRLVLVACGGAMLLASATPAVASGTGSSPTQDTTVATAPADGPSLTGLPYPDRATRPSPQRAARPRPTPSPEVAPRATAPAVPITGRTAATGTPVAPLATTPHREHRLHVVQEGDTLWAIAEQSLPPGATSPEVDARWRAIHRRNSAVVGADPHLIVPGQRLDVPGHAADQHPSDPQEDQS